MKIVVLGTRGFPHVQGGVERHCEELYPRLVRLGCEVTVFTRTPYISEHRRIKEWKGIKFIHLWCPQKKSFEALTHTFLGVLKSLKLSPDVLHIHAIGPSLLVPIAKSLGLKIVMTHHGPDYERAKWGSVAKFVLKKGEKLGVKYSDKIIAISKGIQRHIESNYHKEAIFIPNGVNIPKLIPPGDALKKWHLQPKKYIFTACRFVPEKGLHDLVRAYRKISSHEFKLVIAGDADHETAYSIKLKRMIDETESVVRTGFITGATLGELFSNAALFVLPSYYEGLPIALLEAMSYRIPVLVSDIAPHKEIPLRAYRYFETGNVNKLTEALLKLIKKGIDEEEKKEYLSILRKDYNWNKIAERTLEVYKSLK